MRKIFLSLSVILAIVVISTLSGCMLPQVIIRSQTSPNSVNEQPTVEVTQTPSPTPTLSGISPTFTIAPVSNPNTAILPGLSDVIARVRPSVVAINTSTKTTSIFGGTFDQEGAGSGWIIDAKGLIVTNNHVVEGAESIFVTLEDNRQFKVESVRTDAISDLAVLKIGATNLPAVNIGDSSKSRVGDWVIAIGNSLGEGIRASEGIISAKGVSVEVGQGQFMDDLIDSTAAINPGNSGGPLVNLAGEVIGINSIKVSQIGVEGMGYAISSQAAVPIINKLIANGFVARPWLGVKLYEVDPYTVNQLDLKVEKGVLLAEVVSGGPASKAGMKKYDVITVFDGQTVTTVKDLVKLIRENEIGETVQITCWRGSSQYNMDLTLEQAPPPA